MMNKIIMVLVIVAAVAALFWWYKSQGLQVEATTYKPEEIFPSAELSSGEPVVVSPVYKLESVSTENPKIIRLSYNKASVVEGSGNAPEKYKYEILVMNKNGVYRSKYCKSSPCPQYKEVQKWTSGGRESTFYVNPWTRKATLALEKLPEGATYFLILYYPWVSQVISE